MLFLANCTTSSVALLCIASFFLISSLSYSSFNSQQVTTRAATGETSSRIDITFWNDSLSWGVNCSLLKKSCIFFFSSVLETSPVVLFLYKCLCVFCAPEFLIIFPRHRRGNNHDHSHDKIHNTPCNFLKLLNNCFHFWWINCTKFLY